MGGVWTFFAPAFQKQRMIDDYNEPTCKKNDIINQTEISLIRKI